MLTFLIDLRVAFTAASGSSLPVAVAVVVFRTGRATAVANETIRFSERGRKNSLPRIPRCAGLHRNATRCPSWRDVDISR